MTAGPVSPHQPCRGRRPRRPFPSFTAGPTASQGLRAAGAARKGGTPGEGPPFDPLLRFISTGGVPRAAARGQGSAPGPRPLFCKKAGQKTFTGPDFCQPKPLAAAASDSIRPRSGHLSGRVAAPTRVGEAGGSRNLTGAPPPQALFFGAPPRFFGQDQRNGVDKQHNLKSSRTNRRVPPTHPRAGMEPRPYGTGCAPRFATKKRAPCGARLVAGRGFEPTDLRVMSPSSYRTAPPRDIESLIIIARPRLSVNTFFIAGSAGGPPCPGTCRRRW